MIRRANLIAGILVLVLVPVCVAGCGTTASELGTGSSNLLTDNGQMQNGQMQNGQMQNGQMQNGAPLQLTGANLARVYRLITLPDAAHPDPAITSSNLVAIPNVRLDKTTLTDGNRSGAVFVGHIIQGTMSNGVNGWIYVEAVGPSADPEILHYTLKVRHQFVPAPGQACTGPHGDCVWLWDYACGVDDQGHPRPATAIGGQWDYQQGVPGGGRKLIEQSSTSYDRQITFACSAGAIGKCVEVLKYKPWMPAALECSGTSAGLHCQQPTRELLHEACVRMVRADYCGDGQPHTVTGVDIDVWDQSSVNTMTPYGRTVSQVSVPFGHEAEWTANGARCLSSLLMTRVAAQGTILTMGSYLTDTAHCKDKWATQGNHWDDGDCFGRGPVSLHSTYSFSNVPWGASGPAMDLHDRVLIQNKSVCVDDGPLDSAHPNPLRYDRPWCSACLPDKGFQVVCPLPIFE